MIEQNQPPSIDGSENSTLPEGDLSHDCPLDCPNRIKVVAQEVEEAEEKSKAGGVVASIIAVLLIVLMSGQVYRFKDGEFERQDDPNLALVFGFGIGAAVFAGVSIPRELLALFPYGRGGN